MTTEHLSDREQQECLIDRPAPHVLRHLAECVACRSAVQQLEAGLAGFRNVATAWSSECLAERPRQLLHGRPQQRFAMPFRWVLAAALPLVLLLCVLLGLHLATSRSERSQTAQTPTGISDDALLQQVDEQLSVAVPSSMESLTHLVSTDPGATGAANVVRGSKRLAETN
jgi:hypothetical protein